MAEKKYKPTTKEGLVETIGDEVENNNKNQDNYWFGKLLTAMMEQKLQEALECYSKVDDKVIESYLFELDGLMQEFGDSAMRDQYNMLYKYLKAKDREKYLRKILSPATSKGIIHKPKTKKELIKLARDSRNYLGDIDISLIKDLSKLFESSMRKDFGGLETWDVSHVTNMESMFDDAENFNHDIGCWDVSNVENMERMFFMAEQFNQDISKWNVGSVMKMKSMFYSAKSFKQNLDSWQFSSEFLSSSEFYGNSTMFIQSPLESNPPIWYKNRKAKKVNGKFQPINRMQLEHLVRTDTKLSEIDTSLITDMSGLFRFNRGETLRGLESWDVSNVEDMESMFYGITKIECDIGGWNVSKVKNMKNMFRDVEFNQDISKWDVSNVENMESMFNGASKFNQDISSWNVGKVKNMENMFCGAKKFKQNLDSWRPNVILKKNCFKDGPLESNPPKWYNDINLNLGSDGFYHPQDSEELEQLIKDGIKPSIIDVSDIISFRSLFLLEEVDVDEIKNWNVSNAKSLYGMFSSAKPKTSNTVLDLSSWNVSNVTDMDWLFHNSSFSNIICDNWEVGENVTMKEMFKHSCLARRTPKWYKKK